MLVLALLHGRHALIPISRFDRMFLPASVDCGRSNGLLTLTALRHLGNGGYWAFSGRDNLALDHPQQQRGGHRQFGQRRRQAARAPPSSSGSCAGGRVAGSKRSNVPSGWSTTSASLVPCATDCCASGSCSDSTKGPRVARAEPPDAPSRTPKPRGRGDALRLSTSCRGVASGAAATNAALRPRQTVCTLRNG